MTRDLFQLRSIRFFWIAILGVFTTCNELSAAETKDEDTLSIGLYKSPPFVMTNERGIVSGMAVSLWEKIAAELSLKTRYKFYESYKDIILATASGDIDVAVTSLTITKKRAETVNFTQPWFDSGLQIMVAKEQGHGLRSVVSGLSSAGHLKVYAWMALIVCIATAALTVFDRKFDPDFPPRWRDGLAEGFYTVMSVMTSGRPPARSKLFGWIGRIFAGFWLLCGIAVLAYITSSITSVMTSLAISGVIHGPDDLPGKTIGVLEGSVAQDYCREAGLQSRSYRNIDDAAKALENKKIDAVISDAPVLQYFAGLQAEQNLEVVGELFEPDKFGFALPIDSELDKPITVALLGLKEGGFVEELREFYFGEP